ncbi:unnamed protein product [Leptidea sinapis]|uniref:Uncharacterized protein n=1 Tax=Leptidea sinapis TaxID=189913 RepID=A0A5E4PR88_9NEOP|nr:unnamed protein product [Leptidea sinapis]
MRSVLVCLFFCVITNVIASGDDRFIKKYAMMKIYESCFGPEVVKQIRREMKEAYAKCASPPPVEESSNQHNIPAILLGKLPPGFTMDPSTQTITKPTDGAVHNQDNEDIPEKVHIQKGFQQQAIPPYMMANQYRPYSPASPFYPFPYSPAMFYPQYNPYGYQQPQQQQFYQQPYFGSNRISVKNITCVMQELGYIDHDLEPNYEQITQRIANLPVSADLKGDIQDGLQFCQKFSQCVPDIKRDMAPLSQELIKPMFFFRCYKHKKLEACIMKDIRERFTTEDELDTDGDFGRRSR